MRHPLYAAALAAEAAWMAGLVQVYGVQAPAHRYLQDGHAGPVLGPLYQAWADATGAWRAYLCEHLADEFRLRQRVRRLGIWRAVEMEAVALRLPAVARAGRMGR